MFGLGKLNAAVAALAGASQPRPLPPRLGNCAFAPILITCSIWGGCWFFSKIIQDSRHRAETNC
jgi:hypothetical protein